ncbi:Phospholipase A2, partial [Zea mays]
MCATSWRAPRLPTRPKLTTRYMEIIKDIACLVLSISCSYHCITVQNKYKKVS